MAAWKLDRWKLEARYSRKEVCNYRPSNYASVGSSKQETSSRKSTKKIRRWLDSLSARLVAKAQKLERLRE